MSKKRHFIPFSGVPRMSREETQAAIEEFLNNGGEIIRLRSDDGSYDKNLRKTKESLKGGFNPFSKTDALRIK